MTVDKLKIRYEKIRSESQKLFKELSPLLNKYKKLAHNASVLINEINEIDDDGTDNLYIYDWLSGEVPNGWDDSIIDDLAILGDCEYSVVFLLNNLREVARSKFKTIKKPKLSKFPKL